MSKTVDSPDSEWERRRWLVLALFTPIAVALDQITKKVADSELANQPVVQVVEGFFLLRYSRNRGAFFSLGEDMPDDYRRLFFVAATVIAIGFIAYLYRKAESTMLRGALLLLLSGAVGNMIDRVLYGEVIDFLHLHYQDAFHWATFNVADIYIAVGLVMLVVDLIWRPRTSAAADRTEAA